MNCRVYGMQAKWRRIMLGITVGEIAEATGGKIIFGIAMLHTHRKLRIHGPIR